MRCASVSATSCPHAPHNTAFSQPHCANGAFVLPSLASAAFYLNRLIVSETFILGLVAVFNGPCMLEHKISPFW